MIPAGRPRSAHRCAACGRHDLVPFADLGEIPVFCGVHWASRAEALASPLGRMWLAYCPECGYVRNLAFDPTVLVYDTTMDTNLHHSPAFGVFSAELVKHLAERYPLRGGTVLDIGCGQGEFLRELCSVANCRGIGYDAMYAGSVGPDPSGAVFHRGSAPLDDDTPAFDLVTSRHWFEHLDDPYGFLVRLRELAGDRPVCGYLEVPDAGYDLATAGWEVIYPHVSYFDGYSLCRIAERAGWRVTDTGRLFSGMFRFVEISVNVPGPVPGTGLVGSAGGTVLSGSVGGTAFSGSAGGTGLAGSAGGTAFSGSALPGSADRDRQLASIAGFASRHVAERKRWRRTIERLIADGDRPVLWGAGSRGVQFLHLADPDRRLAAVVDVNPRKWGRYLPVTGHEVSAPETLAGSGCRSVIITNPAYRDEIDAALRQLGVHAELLVA